MKFRTEFRQEVTSESKADLPVQEVTSESKADLPVQYSTKEKVHVPPTLRICQ